jgi:hypothetical protein
MSLQTDTMFRHPLGQQAIARVVKVHDGYDTAFGEVLASRFERSVPAGIEHRKAVAEQDEIERLRRPYRIVVGSLE